MFERCGVDNCVTSDDPPVMRFATDGMLLAGFGADMFVRPHGMYVDDEGNVWVTDGRAARTSTSGTRGTARSRPSSPLTRTTVLYGTIGEGVTLDAAGQIFVGEVSINGMTMFMPM